MRVLVDIPEQQLQELNAICAANELSRAEAIRQSVATFIAGKRSSPEQAFGLWSSSPVDGLAYQAQVRAEW